VKRRRSNQIQLAIFIATMALGIVTLMLAIHG
jgi:hypothetical protein